MVRNGAKTGIFYLKLYMSIFKWEKFTTRPTPDLFKWNFYANYPKAWSLFLVEPHTHCCLLIQKRIVAYFFLHRFTFFGHRNKKQRISEQTNEWFLWCAHGHTWFRSVIQFYFLKRLLYVALSPENKLLLYINLLKEVSGISSCKIQIK